MDSSYSSSGSGYSSSGDQTVDISIGITVISSNAGGIAATQMMDAPSMAAGMTHQVTVGGSAGLVYTPNTLEAAIGDMVQFTFMSENHTVTQAAFAKPCVKLSGVDSGFMPNPNNTVNPAPSFVFQVTTSDPTWFYCRQKGHCGKGMVFSINPSANKTQAEFQQMAIQQNGTMTMSSASVQAADATTMTTYSTVTVAANTMYMSTTTAAAAAVSSTGSTVVSGSGSSSSDGTCSCSCLCGVAAFPPDAGMGMFGGMSGSMSY
ncbi:MAG: hypothetical protein M1827_002889 [Pycnora praestabilis]|nr:MAG: hypothetical protein M1827_002889 [Pycnora praestabilis]